MEEEVIIEKTLNEKTFYFAFDADGNRRWYSADPSFSDTPEELETNIEDELIRFLGSKPTLICPAKIRFKAAFIRTTQEFNLKAVTDIRQGAVKYVSDGEGTYVEIANRPTDDPDFPLIGVLFGPDGAVFGSRRYNGRGECSDGDPAHALFVIIGTPDTPEQE